MADTAEIQPEKQSNSVLIKRYPDEYTVIGSSKIIMDLEEASQVLARNPWMRLWVAAKIKEALLAGETFQSIKRPSLNWRGREDGVVGEYRLATLDEVLNYVDTSTNGSMNGGSISRRSQEKGYTLMYHEGPVLIEAYEELPRQAQVILDIMNEAGRENFTEASISVLLTVDHARLRTKQDGMAVFGFYRKRFVNEGHLVPTEEEDDV